MEHLFLDHFFMTIIAALQCCLSTDNWDVPIIQGVVLVTFILTGTGHRHSVIHTGVEGT